MAENTFVPVFFLHKINRFLLAGLRAGASGGYQDLVESADSPICLHSEITTHILFRGYHYCIRPDHQARNRRSIHD